MLLPDAGNRAVTHELRRQVTPVARARIAPKSNSGPRFGVPAFMPPMSPSTIFIIDDDTSVRRALGRVMSQAGFAWEAYDSAETFLSAAKPGDGDCIVADMTMPGMSGLDLKTLLESTRIHLPLILLTAQDTEETRAAARHAGAAAFFRKPVDIHALLDSIQWALQGATPSDPTDPPR